MPNNEFDKILNEKLQGYQAGFNPADWQKMEALMPQDSRKPMLLIALLFGTLLLSIGGLIVNHFLHEKPVNGNSLTLNSKSSQLATSPAGSKDLFIPEGQNESLLEKENIKISVTGSSEQTTVNQTPSDLSAQNNSKYSGANNSSNTSAIGDASSITSLRPLKSEKTAKSSKKNQEGNINKEGSFKVKAGNKSIEPEESNNAEFLARQNAEMIDPLVWEEMHEYSTDAVKRKGRKVFAFGFGVSVGPTLSFIDAGHLTKPGYTAGIFQEFMFINRIGIVLSESYAERKYDGGQYPCMRPGSDCPVSYSSDVKSVDFGIDVKANLLYKTRWDWYVKAGVINVIKLNETFEYNYPNFDTIPVPTNPSNLSNSTNFGANTPTENFDAATGGLSSDRITQPDLTISGTKRYHIAYHVATGFDISINSTLKLQLETGYSFTKPTVGPEDKRLHSIGIDGRLFFLF